MKHTPQNPFGPQVVHGDLRRTLVRPLRRATKLEQQFDYVWLLDNAPWRYFDRSQNMNYFAYTEEQRIPLCAFAQKWLADNVSGMRIHVGLAKRGAGIYRVHDKHLWQTDDESTPGIGRVLWDARAHMTAHALNYFAYTEEQR